MRPITFITRYDPNQTPELTMCGADLHIQTEASVHRKTQMINEHGNPSLHPFDLAV